MSISPHSPSPQTSIYLAIAKAHATDMARKFIDEVGSASANFEVVRSWLREMAIPDAALPTNEEINALVAGGQQEPGLRMGDVVKRVLTRLNYEHDDWAATKLLSVILANEELSARIAAGAVTT